MIPSKPYTEAMAEMRESGKVRTTSGQVVKIGFFDPKQQPPPSDRPWGLFIKGGRIMVGRHVRSSDNLWEFVREEEAEVADTWQA
jgi:hypothetical protein